MTAKPASAKLAGSRKAAGRFGAIERALWTLEANVAEGYHAPDLTANEHAALTHVEHALIVVRAALNQAIEDKPFPDLAVLIPRSKP